MSVFMTLVDRLFALAMALFKRAVRHPKWRPGPASSGHGGRLRARQGAFHAPNHTWLAMRGPAELAIGIDRLASELLREVTSVELPRPGRGEGIVLLHAGGHGVRKEAPLDGLVVRTNPRLVREPWLLKEEPHGEGFAVLGDARGRRLREAAFGGGGDRLAQRGGGARGAAFGRGRRGGKPLRGDRSSARRHRPFTKRG